MSRSVKTTFPLFFAIALSLMVTRAPVARAHETDQFTPPAGREFADIGEELTKTAYTAIDRGVNKINAKIKGEIDGGKSGEQYETPDAIAAAVNSEFPAAMFLIDDYDKRVLLPASKMNYPGELVGYKPGTTVRKYVEMPLNPFNAWECATIKAYGVMMGTDKIGHFTDMGMHYFRGYRKAIKEGANEDQARAKAVWIGTDDFVFAESGLLGWATAGAYSNADLVANFSGMNFYLNLSEPVMLKGAKRPPMLVRDGAYWRIAPHVRPDSDFFSLFFSEHLDEALNPSVYLPKMRDGIRRAVKEHSNDILERYVDANGNRRGQQYFRDKLAELSTYWGVDYGHKGGATDLLSIPAVCYGNDLDQNAPANARDRVGRTPLHIAAEHGDLATIGRLLDQGADVNVQVRSNEARDTDWGNTPLHLAARDGQIGAVQLLLDRGANIDARNDRGVTPLHRSIGYPEVTKYLLDRGAQVDATDSQGRTALHWAAFDPQAKASEVLLARRANVNVADVDGETPLHRAARAANTHAMDVLVAAGANVNLADKSGATPLHLAARSDHAELAQMLIARGAQVDVRDKFGCTPLHDATHARGQGVVAMLISSGAKRDLANAYGVTPLQLAERTKREAIAGLIKGTTQRPAVASTAELATERQGPDAPIPTNNPAAPKKPMAAGN